MHTLERFRQVLTRDQFQSHSASNCHRLLPHIRRHYHCRPRFLHHRFWCVVVPYVHACRRASVLVAVALPEIRFADRGDSFVVVETTSCMDPDRLMSNIATSLGISRSDPSGLVRGVASGVGVSLTLRSYANCLKRASTLVIGVSDDASGNVANQVVSYLQANAASFPDITSVKASSSACSLSHLRGYRSALCVHIDGVSLTLSHLSSSPIKRQEVGAPRLGDRSDCHRIYCASRSGCSRDLLHDAPEARPGGHGLSLSRCVAAMSRGDGYLHPLRERAAESRYFTVNSRRHAIVIIHTIYPLSCCAWVLINRLSPQARCAQEMNLSFGRS